MDRWMLVGACTVLLGCVRGVSAPTSARVATTSIATLDVCCLSVVALLDYASSEDTTSYRHLLSLAEKPAPVVVLRHGADGGLEDVGVTGRCLDSSFKIVARHLVETGEKGIVVLLVSVSGGVVAIRSMETFRAIDSTGESLNSGPVWIPADLFRAACAARDPTGTERNEAESVP